MRDGSEEKKNKRIEDFPETFAVEDDCRPQIKILKTKYFLKVHI